MGRSINFQILIVGAVVAAASLLPQRAGAIEVKKSLYSNQAPAGAGGAPAQKSPFSKDQMQKLNEAVAGDTDTFTAAESEKKASGQVYADLEAARPRYFPSGPSAVDAKMEAIEYKPAKSGAGKGSPTGKKRTLVLKYKLDGGKWTQADQPKWEESGGGPVAAAAGKKP